MNDEYSISMTILILKYQAAEFIGGIRNNSEMYEGTTYILILKVE